MESLDYINSISEDKLELDQHAIPSIVEYIAKTNNDITYGDLAKAVTKRRGRKMDQRGFAKCLERIQHYCDALALPCLSAMVVVSGENATGKGFITCYLELHPELKGLPEYQIRAKERKEVFGCNEWQKLYDYVGVDEKAPEMRDKYLDWAAQKKYEEGEKMLREAHEESKRNPAARAECIRIKGKVCQLCERDSKEIYGVEGIIEVHHIRPLNSYSRSESHFVDPVKDLIPVCPTCHAVLHSKNPQRQGDCYTPNEIREMLGKPPLPEYE